MVAHEHIKPVELIHTPAGEQVFDMGQNFAGIFTFRVKEPAGTKIHIQTGEVLQKGNFYNENLRSAKSEYIYISDGNETVIRPHFTYYGYRYVKVEGVSDLAREQIMEMLQRPRRPEPVSDVFTILHTAMEGGRGDAVMFVWGMAEAISFPIMAEMSQVWLGLTHLSGCGGAQR